MSLVAAQHEHAVPHGATRRLQYVIVFAVLIALVMTWAWMPR